MTRLAIAINLDRCVGCHTCALSCKMQNNVPEGMLWNRVLTEDCDVMDGALGTYPNVTRTFLPVACQHCQNAACQRVCPTGATYRDDKGRVEIDYDKCIGCRMCMAACPYNARNFNWQTPVRVTGANYGDAEVPVRPKGVAEKCTLCKERTDRGEGAHVRRVLPVPCAHLRRLGRSGQRDFPDHLNRKAWTLLKTRAPAPPSTTSNRRLSWN